MTKITPNKICILVDTLSFGGAEKAAGVLSKTLEKSGYNVLVVCLRNDITYPYAGQLVNLGLNHSNFKVVKQIQKVLRLKKVVNNFHPNIIIDFRLRNRFAIEFVLNELIFKNKKIIYTIHSALKAYQMPQGNYFKSVYNKKCLVAVSKEITNDLIEDGFNNVVHIPNAIDNVSIENQSKDFDVNERYIIAIGRLFNETKQFDELIKRYKLSSLSNEGIKLYIVGDGEDRDLLENLITELELVGKVELLGYKKNPYPYIKNAQFTVLCSKVEGLPMVILESLSLATPVISFKCKSGPEEMITHNKNGLLVEDQNWDSLLKTMELLVSDVELSKQLRANTEKYLVPFSQENYLKNWIKIINKTCIQQ